MDSSSRKDAACTRVFPNQEDCAKCHSERNGEDFSLIHWIPLQKGFDHTQTRYKLEGEHAGIEFKPDCVVLEVNGATQPLPNDYTWIFAGGGSPTAFLKKIGIQFGKRDLATEVRKEASRPATPASRTSPLVGTSLRS